MGPLAAEHCRLRYSASASADHPARRPNNHRNSYAERNHNCDDYTNCNFHRNRHADRDSHADDNCNGNLYYYGHADRDGRSIFTTSHTYPITVRDSMLGPDGFINPDGYYSDETYQNKTWKRISLHDQIQNPSGGFAWLRWSDAAGDQQRGATARATVAMMTSPGNIAGGFDEATWPSSNSLNLPKPFGYPLQPGQLSPGDWAYANLGVVGSSALRIQLDYHKAYRTHMTLPIFDASAGGGNGTTYHISRPGTFLLLGYSVSNPMYLDLVYIRHASARDLRWMRLLHHQHKPPQRRRHPTIGGALARSSRRRRGPRGARCPGPRPCQPS